MRLDPLLSLLLPVVAVEPVSMPVLAAVVIVVVEPVVSVVDATSC